MRIMNATHSIKKDGFTALEKSVLLFASFAASEICSTEDIGIEFIRDGFLAAGPRQRELYHPVQQFRVRNSRRLPQIE